VFWDNRSLIHLAAGCPAHLRRKLYRTTIQGDALSDDEDSIMRNPSAAWRPASAWAPAWSPAAAAPTVAHAEGKIRIAEQFGIVYLLLNVVRDQQLIEKHGKQQGIDIKVDWTQLSGGAAINDALLSGSVDIAGAGVGPLLTIWDRTKGRQNVKAVASLGNFPYYLVSSNLP
jgi:ABC-type nitrate/sulfonate/bicarbonate transport system substrate-binding protein